MKSKPENGMSAAIGTKGDEFAGPGLHGTRVRTAETQATPAPEHP